MTRLCFAVQIGDVFDQQHHGRWVVHRFDGDRVVLRSERHVNAFEIVRLSRLEGKFRRATK